MKLRDVIGSAVERALRRGLTLGGGALVVSGNDLSVAAGVVLVLGEYAFEQMREYRRRKKAAKE
jgi:hypothetical protein